MIVLTIRTDKPESEIGLYDDSKELVYLKWQAHRQLAETIHQKIQEALDARQKTLNDIGGIVVYKGPGSFTGLRIGMSVANALAYSLGISVAGVSGNNWLREGLSQIQSGKGSATAMPEYGEAANVTTPKK